MRLRIIYHLLSLQHQLLLFSHAARIRKHCELVHGPPSLQHLTHSTLFVLVQPMHYTVWVALSIFYRLFSVQQTDVFLGGENQSPLINIVEVGSYSFTGLTAASVLKLAQFPELNFPSLNVNYTGIDHIAGPNVDVVIGMETELPFADNSVDVIISTSAFEHDQMFWITFLELLRILKPNGFLFLQAPSAGVEHRTPTDNWRFYRDAPFALEKWARYSGKAVDVATSYIHDSKETRKVSLWADHSMIFWKPCGDSCSRAFTTTEKVKDLWSLFGDFYEEALVSTKTVLAYFHITNHTLGEYDEEEEGHDLATLYKELSILEWW